jgi:isopenicillin N synthase-like dioxygenase
MAIDITDQPEIPLISLVKSTPKEVLRALSTVGFIHLDLEGTGLTQNDINQAFKLSSLIHSVSIEERAGSMKDPSGNGYFSMKGSLDERTSKTDFKESFVWGRFNSSTGETGTTQGLPSSIQKHRQEIVDFDNKCFEASLRVLDILSQALDVSHPPRRRLLSFS